ncbi:MAG: hydrolase [Eubacteriales bacterium]
MHVERINRENAVLLVIDFQEKLVPAIKDNENLVETVAKLIRGCNVLELPIIFTQQYTRGLGDTVPKIKEALGEAEAFNLSFVEKTSFSCNGEEDFRNKLDSLDKQCIIVCGIETHICVQLTVLDLLYSGYIVYLINDAIGSRNNNDKKYAQRRMSEAGAIGTTYEAILFEILKDAKAAGFKEISEIIK